MLRNEDMVLIKAGFDLVGRSEERVGSNEQKGMGRSS